MEMLPEEDQEIVVTKYKGAEADNGTSTSLREQNQFLMALLLAHCEMKQARHVHDTAENRYIQCLIILLDVTQFYLLSIHE